MDSYSEYSKTIVDVWKYSSLLLMAIGITGNMLSLITVTSKHCKKSSFTVYLAALAIADSTVLILSSIDTWLLRVYQINLEQYGTSTCKLLIFFLFLFSDVSSWLIVAITIERAVSTLFLQRFSTIYSLRSGCVTVGIITGFFASLNIHLVYGVSYTFSGNFSLCGYVDIQYEDFFFSYFVWIDLVVYSILPIILIIIGNAIIVIKFNQARKAVAPITNSGQFHLSQTNRRYKRQLLVITLMISMAFIVFTLPISIITTLRNYIFSDDSSEGQAQIADTVVFVLFRLNYSMNFFFYVLSGKRFRRDLKSALCCRQKIDGVSTISYPNGELRMKLTATSSMSQRDTNSSYKSRRKGSLI